MLVRTVLMAAALFVTGCDQVSAPQSASVEAPQLDSPAPESEPARPFSAANEAARAATGDITMTMATRLPDANQAGAAPQDVVTLRGANGLIVEGEITGAISPATQIEGQTIRALLQLPVEEPQVLVYRVASETKPESGQGLCGANAAAFIVIWEPSGPGDGSLKAMGVSGGAPGAAGARLCPMLDYRRN
ncbi:MAG: hypothetical protein NW206_05185 [Hyphomonadaceae bacterium]|nr:hypothetical protein [Hyphomonadaceae bacterium]